MTHRYRRAELPRPSARRCVTGSQRLQITWPLAVVASRRSSSCLVMIENDCCGVMRGWLGRLCVCVCCFFHSMQPRAHACCFCVCFAVLWGHYHVGICALRRASYATAFDPCARSLPRGLNLSMETELERCSAVRGQFIACITMAHDCACS
jgi:hypothetical protein